jgi:prevent-host-death family protein
LNGLTRDTVLGVTTVTIRELRNRGGDVVDRVEAGEHVLVTRDGKPVAELRPLSRSALTASELLRRRRNLPAADPVALRRDVDEVIAPAL